jgi:ABC-type dipeptide/oligopeptide/nickel transport system permease subunit
MAETAAPLGADSERLQTPALLLPKKSLLRQLIKDRTALVGLVILAIVFAAAVAAPVIAPHDPHDQDVVNRYAPPSSEHLLGTDNLGRDNLSRLMYGARVSLFSALAVGVAILLIGISVGLLSGFVGGFIDGLLMRIIDVLLAFPSLLLALAITGMLGPGLFHLLIGMTAVWWTEYARVMRGLVLSMKERPFVESARALGLPAHRVALRHILPNIVSPVVVLGTLRTGQLLLALSALSFLGLGVQPPTAEWGAMLSEGQNYLASAPQLMLYPGVAITISALGFNLLGDGLRDVLDPTLR